MSKPNLPPLPSLQSVVVNDACWRLIDALPRGLPGSVLNDLKPAVYAALCHALPIYAEEAVRQALAAQAKSLRDFADRKYCQAIEYGRRNEALGWESKAKGGRFGTDEYACHQKMNEAFGAHFVIYEALKQVALIPENSNGEST
ncbi:hypothetical protein ELS24_10135 [Achromobacter spanius]|uniref:hypothetical protein n=1 Tax=Achromobacter spanius TaxID=217203 RepID=UPI000F8FA655|nr:hypothetical protein [Achromobacter spanius]AZS78770.1 hypothetical protein ELS24_10135 [Achromobacter spanius]